MSKVVAFLKDDLGATAIEYGLIAAGISVVIIATVNAIGTNLNAKFDSISTQPEVTPSTRLDVTPCDHLLEAAALPAASFLETYLITAQCPLWVKSRHVQCTRRCPLCANSGHSQCKSDW